MDDIVTRLHSAVRHCGHDWNLGDEWFPAPTTCSDCERQKQAADEIERLRAEVDSADAVAYRSLKGLYDKQHEHISLLLEQRDRAWADYAKLKDTRIDLQAVENIVGSVQDVLLAARRQYDTSLIQNDLIESKDKEVERLQAAGDVLASLLDRCVCSFDGNPCAFCLARTEWQEVRRG